MLHATRRCVFRGFLVVAVCLLVTIYRDIPLGYLFAATSKLPNSLQKVPDAIIRQLLDYDANEAACYRFFRAVDCSGLLEPKGDQHKLTLLEEDWFLDLRHVLLVVHFTLPSYNSAAKVYSLYKRKIVFCGPSDAESEFAPHNWTSTPEELRLPHSVRFLPYGKIKIPPHTNSYRCLPLVLEKLPESRYNYDGFLLMSDDVVPNYWNWKRYGKSLDKAWVMGDTNIWPFSFDTAKFCTGRSGNDSVDCTSEYDWFWLKVNRKETTHFYDHLVDLANYSLIHENSTYWGNIVRNLTKITGGSRRLLGRSNTDMLYVPRGFLQSVGPILALMSHHRVFMEIAVVTAIRATIPSRFIQQINAAGLDWGQGHIRRRPFIDAYSTKYEMVHPFKLSNLTISYSNLTNACIYCNLLKFADSYTRRLDGVK